MDPSRFVVSDAMWSRLEGLFPGKATDRGVMAADTRLFLEAVFWRVRTGSLCAIFLAGLATGTVRSGGSGIGRAMGCSTGFSSVFRAMRTWNML